jgi:hypothetical protein
MTVFGCSVHPDFFDKKCEQCKKEYAEMKGINQPQLQQQDSLSNSSHKKYKEFTEDRAKKLYEELLLQYLKNGESELQASQRAKSIVRKQCSIRHMKPWEWT